MLEWLSSKMAVALGAMLLLSSVTAFFACQRESIRRIEIGNVARGIAGFIDAVLDLTGETKFVVACDGDAALIIPKEVGGSPYEIHLRRDSVIIAQEGRTMVAHWTGELHFWQHHDMAIDTEVAQGLDADYLSLDLLSCQRFEIAVDAVLIDGSARLFAFADLAN
jgi:hypothetical protein